MEQKKARLQQLRSPIVPGTGVRVLLVVQDAEQLPQIVSARPIVPARGILQQAINQLDSVFSLESEFTAEVKQTTGG